MSFNAPPELQRQYLERRQQEIRSAIHAAGEEKERTVRTLAHQVLGNARTFGFDELEAHAKRLQKIIHSSGWTESRVDQALEDFERDVQRLKDSGVAH